MVDSVATSAPDEPRFAIGRALALSFGVLGRNLGPMAAISLAVTAVQSVVEFAVSDMAGDESIGAFSTSTFLDLASYAVITAPMTYATFQDLRGARVGMRSILSNGFSIIWRAFAAAVIVAVVAFGPIIAAFFVGIYDLPLTALAALAVAFVLYVFAIWFVLVPVLVVEKIRFFAGFGRALDLSRGRRWSILGLLLVYGVMIVAMGAVMVGMDSVFQDSAIVSLALLVPFNAFTSAIGAILPAVVYYLLRAEKEGVGIDQIARVFD
jgi:hypothetical protein